MKVVVHDGEEHDGDFDNGEMIVTTIDTRRAALEAADVAEMTLVQVMQQQAWQLLWVDVLVYLRRHCCHCPGCLL